MNEHDTHCGNKELYRCFINAFVVIMHFCIVAVNASETLEVYVPTYPGLYGETVIGLGGFSDMVFSPNGQYIVGSGESGIYVIDAKTLELILPILYSRKSNRFLAISPDSCTAAVDDYRDNSITIYDAETGKENCRIHVNEPIRKFAFSPDNSKIAFVSDNFIGYADVDDGDMISIHQIDLLLESVLFSADGKKLLFGGLQGIVYELELYSDTLSPCFQPGFTIEILAGVREKESLIAVGGRSGRIQLWNAETKEMLCELSGHTGTVYSFSLANDGKRLISGSNDGTARIWDIREVSGLKGWKFLSSLIDPVRIASTIE